MTSSLSSKAIQTFAPARPSVGHERILRIQGYSDFSRVRPAIVAAARAMAEVAEGLAGPRVSFTRVPILAVDSTCLHLVNGIRLHCRAFASILAACSEVAVFVLSLGTKFDERVVALTETGDLLEALLLETAGWLCIEDATRQFKMHLRATAAAAGLRITSRMGPGYTYRAAGQTCSWPLDEQATLFSAFGDADLPAQVTSSHAMLPKMSRSGLFGIGPVASTNPPAPVDLERLAVNVS